MNLKTTYLYIDAYIYISHNFRAKLYNTSKILKAWKVFKEYVTGNSSRVAVLEYIGVTHRTTVCASNDDQENNFRKVRSNQSSVSQSGQFLGRMLQQRIHD